MCFSEDAQRFSALDVQITEKLEGLLEQQSLSRQLTYQALIEAKNSVAGFTFKEMLFKDQKLLEPFDGLRVCTASISGRLAGELLGGEQQAQRLAELKAISVDQGYSLVLIMGITSQDLNSIKRDLALFSLNDRLLQKVRYWPLAGYCCWFSLAFTGAY